jgi:hypothetical protein
MMPAHERRNVAEKSDSVGWARLCFRVLGYRENRYVMIAVMLLKMIRFKMKKILPMTSSPLKL